MSVLVLGDISDGQLDASVAKAVGAASKLGETVDVLLIGGDVSAAAQRASGLSGVRQVLTVSGDAFEHVSAEVASDVVLQLKDECDVFVAAATAFGKAVMPRVAAGLDVMQVSDITAIVGARTFERPAYAGNVIETVEAADGPLVVTVRTSVFDAVGTGNSAPIAARDVSVRSDLRFATFVREDKTVSERPDLAQARVVVSGGRALQSQEQFDSVIGPLADQLGAAIGASRAAVDAGYAPNDLQVGQTGKVVAPELYIAVGISGAIQHVAGMKDSQVVVAINKDGDAPIFKQADYGLVGDLFEIVPQLQEALSAAGLKQSA